jgi:molybdate transport system substrate-binding protein
MWLQRRRAANQNSLPTEEDTVKHAVSFIAIIAFALGISTSVRAQTRITLLSPDPLKREVDAIVQNFEMKTGIKVQESYGTGVGSRRTVQEGGALDVTLLFAPFDDALKTGNVDKSTQTVVARVRLAIAVKDSAAKPDISNAAAVKKLLLNAKSLATVDPTQGSVGGATMLAFDKMGITDQVKPKTKLYPGGGGVQKAVADGEVEVAVGPYLSDYRNPPAGLQVVGALPPDAATPVDITAWISTNAPDKKAAMQLIDYFKGKEAASVWEQAHVFTVTK